MSLGRSLWAASTVGYNVAYNTLARTVPRVAQALQRLTGDTGRGKRCVAEAAGEYFVAVAADFQAIAEHAGVVAQGEDLYRDRTVLELGPGDTLSVPILAQLRGAKKTEAFDAFDIQSRDRAYLDAIYRPMLARAGYEKRRAEGLSLHDACTMHTSLESLERGGRRFDLVLSRAVLEHVRDLDKLFASLSHVVKDDAVMIHEIDLRSHGIERSHPLDFLSFSESTWHRMSSHIDLPNRVRAGEVLRVAGRHGARVVYAGVSHRIEPGRVAEARSGFAPRFRDLGDEELSILGMWFVQVGPSHPAARDAKPIESLALPRAPREKLSRYAQ
jgi:SAM-dependent methyltransferase